MSDIQKTQPRKPRISRSQADIHERLVEGETILKTAVISDFIYWRAVAVFIFAVLLALLVPMVMELGVLLAIVAFIMAAHATILKSILMLVITNKRVLVRYGILQVDVVDIHHDKIESMELERMLTGYFMGYANIVIMGTGSRYIVIPFVANGIELRRAYNEISLNGKEEKA